VAWSRRRVELVRSVRMAVPFHETSVSVDAASPPVSGDPIDVASKRDELTAHRLNCRVLNVPLPGDKDPKAAATAPVRAPPDLSLTAPNEA
jgi:hypothetical protein